MLQRWKLFGANNKQVLEVISADDPFLLEDQWKRTATLHPNRAVSNVIEEAAQELFQSKFKLRLMLFCRAGDAEFEVGMRNI